MSKKPHQEADQGQKTIEQIPLADLIPYARNARTHSAAQISQLCGSLREFGWVNPVLIDGDNNIIAGHGRVLAAQQLGMMTAPCLRISHLTDAQRRAYILADNQLALNSGWDDELLKIELADLQLAEFDVGLLGFSEESLAEIQQPSAGEGEGEKDQTYTNKIVAPIYEPKGEKPPVSALLNREKADQLIAAINAASLPPDVAEFLRMASERHVVFNFRQIAEFYCHADAALQDLMERNGLVIIDFKKAVECGFVHLTERLGAIADLEEADNDDA